ncbi:DUF898 family protein [Paralimibaculum aggregatum]|nr:DUF898 family protein [Limibaculum sp. NKW23]
MTEQAGGPHFWDLHQYKTDTVASPSSGREPQKLRLTLDADAMLLFWIALRSVVLSILTIGIYRFWMITRMRRFYWGAIRIGGDPLEYTGRGIEKLLGFLLALVILAVYLGLVNLGLTFVGLSIASDDPIATQLALNLSVLATLPLIFYALYRSQRYIMARTRWRGIRFGLGPGAWGYVVRGMLLTLLTLLTLGLAYPYQQFKLAKYVTDRAYFGDLPFAQEGSWKELFAQWMWIYIIGGIGAVLVWGLIDNPEDTTAAFLGTLALAFGATIMVVAYFRYQISAFRILWSNRTLGLARFENDLAPARVVGIYLGGGLLVSICTGVVGAAIGFAVFYGLNQVLDPAAMQALIAAEGELTTAQLMEAWPIFAAFVLTYLLIIGFAFAFTQIFIHLRVLRAKVEGMMLVDPEALLESRQREHDPSAEAGGFADALGVDIGAGI